MSDDLQPTAPQSGIFGLLSFPAPNLLEARADGSNKKLRPPPPDTVSAQATNPLRVFGGGQSVGGVIIATTVLTRPLSLLFAWFY
eukprot:scaffold55818_cov61-Cyclotella_meneghiniana.AAC.1